MLTFKSLSTRGRGFMFGCACLVAGCSSQDRVMGPVEAPPGLVSMSVDAPADLVTIENAGHSLTFWPYTSTGLSDQPSDPINLVFVGKASPVAIRTALMALDGDRSSLGLPPVPPFNARWTDAFGDAQGTYATEGGWSGSVIQLALGDYQPIRVHVRLFSTKAPYGDGTWTLGGAHFEVLIPGTTEHQVLSWEVAQQIVVGDLMRSGLVSNVGFTSTINAAPSFRDIPAPIYNELPPELVGLISGPAQPVQDSVPLASDGRANIVELSGEAPLVPGDTHFDMTLTWGLLVPRPFCSSGPLDWVYVEGPVDLTRTASLTADGTYTYTSSYQGRVRVTPMDVTVNPPVPSGEPFDAMVTGNQSGQILDTDFVLTAHDRRIASEKNGIGMQRSRLRVGSSGENSYVVNVRCMEP